MLQDSLKGDCWSVSPIMVRESMWRKYLTVTLIFSPRLCLWLCSLDTRILEMLIWVLIFFLTRAIHSWLWCRCHTSSWLNSHVVPVVWLIFVTVWLGALHLNGTERYLCRVIQQLDQNTWWNFINFYQPIHLKSQILNFDEIRGVWKLSLWWTLCFGPLRSRNNIEDITTSASTDIATLRSQTK